MIDMLASNKKRGAKIKHLTMHFDVIKIYFIISYWNFISINFIVVNEIGYIRRNA